MGGKNNAGVFRCDPWGSMGRTVTNEVELGQPRKIFEGEKGCKNGWKSSFDLSTFVQSSREFLSAYAATLRIPSFS